MRTLFEGVEQGITEDLLARYFRKTVSLTASPRRPAPVLLGGRFSLVLSGTVTVLRVPEPRGASIRLAIFRPGDFLGEMSAFFGTVTAALETRTGVEIASLVCDGDRDEQRRSSQQGNLLALVTECPLVGFNMAAELTCRLMRTNRYLDSGAAERIRYTVALRELERAGDFSKVSDHPAIPLREELAAEAGITTRSVDRTLPGLVKAGVLVHQGGWYAARSWARLTKDLYL